MKPAPFDLQSEAVRSYLNSIPPAASAVIGLHLGSYGNSGQLVTYLWAALETAIEQRVPIPPPVLEYLHSIAGELIRITKESVEGEREAAVYRALGFRKDGLGPGAPISTYQRQARDRDIGYMVDGTIAALRKSHGNQVETAAIEQVAARVRMSESHVRRCYRSLLRRLRKN